MPENAVVSLELKNLQEVLALLREMRDIKRELEEGGNNAPTSTRGTSSVSSTGEGMPIANPSKTVTNLSNAAAGQVAVPSTSGQPHTVQGPSTAPTAPIVTTAGPQAESGTAEPNVAKPSQAAPSPHAQGAPVSPAMPAVVPSKPKPAQPQQPPKAIELKDVIEGLGVFELYQRATSLTNVATGEMGMAIAQGRPFRSEALRPEIGATLITGLGTAIGFGFGGPSGAMLGAAITAPISSAYESFTKPGADRDVALADYRDLIRGQGLGDLASTPQPIIEAGQSMLRHGYRVSSSELERAGGRDTTGFWYGLDSWTGFIDDLKYPNGLSDRDYLNPNDQKGAWANVVRGLMGSKVPGEINDNAPAAADYLQRVQEMRHTPAALAANHGVAPNGWKGDISAMEANLFDDPYGVIGAAVLIQDSTKKGYRQAQDLIGRAERIGTQKATLASETENIAAGASLAQEQLSIAMRHGSAETKEAGERLADRTLQLAEQQRKEAEIYRSSNPRNYDKDKYNAMLERARTTELHAHDFKVLPYLETSRAERDARAEALKSSAAQSFETSLYSGTSASALPWKERSDALTEEIRLLRQSLEEGRRAGEIKKGSVEEYQFNSRIATAQHELSVVLPRERAQMEWEEKYLVNDAEVAKMRASKMPALLRASSETFAAGTYDIEIDTTRKKIDLLEKELSVRKDLTKEERLSKEAQADTLRVQEASLKAAKDLAVISANATISYAKTADTRAQTQVELLRSSGGDQGLTGRMSLLTSAGEDLRTAEKKITDLRKAGYSETSQEMIAARGERDQALVTKEQTRSELIGTPFSATSRIQDTKLQTEGALMQMGYGNYGDVRMNLKAQVQNKLSELHELDSMKENISKRFGWTDEDEVQYQQRRAGLAMETADLAKQYNEGWDQRLISEAFNTPGNGRLAMSQFTKYEATLAGVVHRSFVGTEQTTRFFREQTPRLLGMYGSGNPEEFANHLFDEDKLYPNRKAAMDREKGLGNPEAKKQAELRMNESQSVGGHAQTIRVDAPAVYNNIDIYIDGQRVPDGSKRVRITDNSSQINNFGGVRDVNENAHARQSPVG